MSDLMIVESPAKAKTINKYLGKDFVVLASMGHVSDLPAKSGSVIPDKDFEMIYEINPNSKKNLDAIYKAVEQSNVIYLATDPDREGEAIAWSIAELLKAKIKKFDLNQIKRITFNEITKKSVTEAIKKPRSLDINLINAQQARRALDYLVGFTLSPLLWRKLPGCKSGGRVQSVALRLICEREDEILNFVKQEYWDIFANFETIMPFNEAVTDFVGQIASKSTYNLDNSSNNVKNQVFTAKLTHIQNLKLGKFDIINQDEAIEIATNLKKSNFWVKEIQTKQQSRNPLSPFITSTLQQEASTKLGFNTKKTMMIAQKLYEGLKVDNKETGLITYMRTDGIYISDDAIKSIRDYIQNKFGDKYLPDKPRKYVSKVKNAQEAHEAIRPVDINFSPEYVKNYLTEDEYKLYELIWKRTLACQMSSAIHDILNIFISGKANSDECLNKNNSIYQNLATNHNCTVELFAEKPIEWELKITGSKVSFDGFSKIYKDLSDEDDSFKNMPNLDSKTNIYINNVNEKQHFTEPPPRFTEASLVKHLEELGIGRPSTYASIISVLQDRKYVHMDKKKFLPDPRGTILNIFLTNFFNQYVQYDFTAKLENDLDEISEGVKNYKDFLRKFWEAFIAKINEIQGLKMGEVIDVVRESMEKSLFHTKENRKCTTCSANDRDGEISLKFGKFGAFLACSNYPECKYTEQILTNSENNTIHDDKTENKLPNQILELGFINNKPIMLKSGRFGDYLEVEMDDGTKKRAAITAKVKQNLNSEVAKSLLEFPKLIGNIQNKEKIEEAFLCLGKFGLYIKLGEKNIKIPKNLNPDKITIDDIKTLI